MNQRQAAHLAAPHTLQQTQPTRVAPPAMVYLPCLTSPAVACLLCPISTRRRAPAHLLGPTCCDLPALADPPSHSQTGANPAWVDLVHSAGSLLPPRLRDAIAGFTFTCLPMQLHAVRGVDSVCVAVGAWGGGACLPVQMHADGERHMLELCRRAAAAAATAASRSEQPPPLPLHATLATLFRSHWPCLPPSSRPSAASLRPASSAGEAPAACTCCAATFLCAHRFQPQPCAAVPFASSKPSRCHECGAQPLPLLCCCRQAPIIPAPLTLHPLPLIPAPLILHCSPCALPLQLQDQGLW